MKTNLAKRMKVWIISPFSDPSNADSADRYRYICQELINQGASVCQYISAFDHALKCHRRVSLHAWRCIAVFEPGYTRNVSIQRVISHLIFDFMIFFYFIREIFRSGLPNIVFAVLPHNGAACVAALFAKSVGAKLIVDIHDTWPESILSVAKPNFMTLIAYKVWKACADFSILWADDVFGESIRYAERANNVRDRFRLPRAQAIYIGGDLAYYQGIQLIDTIPIELQGAKFILAYAGTLGENYDLDCLVEAYAAFEKECSDAGLLLLGGGEREAALRSRLSDLCQRAWVSGRISHRAILSYLKRSLAGLNCFKPGGNVAYSYKLNDYLLVGLPVINSLIGETADFISKYDIGVNYQASDPHSLLEAFRLCYSRWQEDPFWGKKVISFSSQALDRKNSYRSLIQSCLDVSN